MLNTVKLLFLSDCIKSGLVLVAAAGSATAGPLELPALGADVGPRGENKSALQQRQHRARRRHTNHFHSGQCCQPSWTGSIPGPLL